MFSKLTITLVFFVALDAFLVSTEPQSAPVVTFEYTDIDNFVHVYASLSESDNPEAEIQHQYIDIGTPALSEYIRRYRLKAGNWVEAFEKAPGYFGSFADLTARLAMREQEISSAYEKLISFYPTAKPLRVNYVIGPMVAGGIQDASGVIVAAEIYGLSANTDMTAVPTKRRLFPTDVIAPIVLHEFAHSLQMDLQGRDAYVAIYGDKTSLLAIAVREGSADFVAELAAGTTINLAAHEYGNRHKAELWALFQEDMYGEETGDWLFYPPKQHPDWPTDLGYFMGYKIVESFYRNAPDKEQALRAILQVTDYKDLVNRSGYDPQH